MFISKTKHDFIQKEKILRKKGGVFLNVTVVGSAERKNVQITLTLLQINNCFP